MQRREMLVINKNLSLFTLVVKNTDVLFILYFFTNYLLNIKSCWTYLKVFVSLVVLY